MRSFKEVLSITDFLYLWLSQVFSQLADRMLVGLLLLQVHNLTVNKIGLAIPMLSFGLSALVFSSIAGVYVDRWRKKNILVSSNIARIFLLTAFIFLPFTTQSLPYIFFISFAIFTVAQFFIPAETSSIPLIVKKNDLTAANSLFMVTWMGSTVVGFALIPFMDLFNLTITHMFVSVAFLYGLAATVACFLHLPEPSLRTDHRLEEIWKDMRVGFELVRRNLTIKATFFNLFVATTIIAILSELAIDFVSSLSVMDKSYFGYFVAIAGVGMFCGIITLNIFKGLSKGIIVSLGFLITGINLIFLSHTSSIIKALILIFLLGVGNGYITIPIQTILQAKTPRMMRGRVFGIQNLVVNSAFIVPVLVGGYLANRFGTSFVFYVLGLSVIVVSSINLLAPKMRKL